MIDPGSTTLNYDTTELPRRSCNLAFALGWAYGPRLQKKHKCQHAECFDCALMKRTVGGCV